MEGIFFKNKSEYTNQLNPIQGYLDQLTHYIAIQKQLPKEQAREKAIQILKTYFKDKSIKYFEREENGDRVVKDGTLYRYIKQNIDQKNILVPTFTSYMNSKIRKSVLSEFIFVNVRKRSSAKKAGQKAKAEGNLELAMSKNNEQNLMKINNNSLSGVFGQSSCILYNPTAHNTLTSITRTMTSLSNANNEKLIAGNRYLPRPIDVFNSIVYITTYADIDKIKEIVDRYRLHLPTVEETVQVLKYSSDLYFYDRNYYLNKIIPFLNKLSPYHLAAICYLGDLYHLRKFNEQFIRQLFDILTTTVETHSAKLDDPKIIYNIDEAVLNSAHIMLYSKVKGYGKDYEKMNEAGIASSVYETSLRFIEKLKEYKDFFNTFFMTDIIPTNSHRLSNMRRRTVVLSDTDSTCFTLDEWVSWYKGEYFVDDKSIALGGVICYIVSQSIVNALAMLSKNMNIEDDLLNTLAMKSEYLWLAFVPTEVSKHYFALTMVQEGNVFKTPDYERKGVHLKNSAVPKDIVQHGNTIMNYILDNVATNKKIKLNKVIKDIIDLENGIMESIRRGEAKYLKKSKIKNKEAYALDEFKSPYQRHQLWVDVFADKYGNIGEPPYDVIKVPTLVTSKKALVSWLESIEDLELRSRLINWLEKYNKNNLPTMYLNETYVIGNGIPDEIIRIINLKQIVFDITMQHRLILGTLGVLLNEDLLVSEQFIL